MLQPCIPEAKHNPTSEQAQIDRAIELAHFIHRRKGVALRVVKDVVCSLDLSWERPPRRAGLEPSDFENKQASRLRSQG